MRKKISNLLWAVGGLYILVELYTGFNAATSVYSVYQHATDLDGEETIYEYMTASHERSLRFYMRMCSGGVCLPDKDWECGFYVRGDKFDERHNGEEFLDLVQSCFYKVAKVLPSYTPIDKVRKICGRHYMVFDPKESHFNKEVCAKNGGKWGKKNPFWAHERALLREAKVR